MSTSQANDAWLNGDTSLSDDDLHDIYMLAEIERRRAALDRVARPMYTSKLNGSAHVDELLNGHLTRMYNVMRMYPDAFRKLAATLRDKRWLRDDAHTHVGVEEALGIFLNCVSHRKRMRELCERFQRSIDTIRRTIKCVAQSLGYLGMLIIKPRDTDGVDPYILNGSKYYPYFNDCIGAIDGTLVAAVVPKSKMNASRSRKGNISQNVMVACNFNMMFTFVHVGWEGSANDSRVHAEVITSLDVDFPRPPQNKYCVVDSGYNIVEGYLAPYRGERYHLHDFEGVRNAPRGPREMFNYKHASLRNVNERCLGVLKARFPILMLMSNYILTRQNSIVNTCFVLHNFIRLKMPYDPLFNEYMIEGLRVHGDEAIVFETPNLSQAACNRMANFRDGLADHIWRDHVATNNSRCRE